MKMIRNTLVIGTAVFLMLLGDAPPDSRLGFQLVPEAQAVLGVWRRHARRWAVVGTAAVATTATVAAADEAAAVEAESAAAQQQAGGQQQAVPRETAAAPPPATAGDNPLPLGTVVSSLPGGCTPTPVGGVQYYYCGGNFYRASFQGNSLVYVTAKP